MGIRKSHRMLIYTSINDNGFDFNLCDMLGNKILKRTVKYDLKYIYYKKDTSILVAEMTQSRISINLRTFEVSEVIF